MAQVLGWTAVCVAGAGPSVVAAQRTGNGNVLLLR